MILGETTGLATVYTAALAPLKGVDIVAAALNALQKSVVMVAGEMGEIGCFNGGGE